VLHGGFAIPQRFYRRFAESLAGHGFVVLTYDHRGVGESRTRPLRGFHATATDWGRLDWGAATRFMKATHPELPLLALCHSFGGQALGLAAEGAWYDGIVTIGSQLGSVGHYSGRNAVWVRSAMYVALPLIAHVFGYVPGWMGLGEDAPKGAVLEWALWCRSPGYLVDHVPGAAQRFAEVQAPVHVIAVADDDYAPLGAVQAFADRLTSADLTLRVISPSDLGVGSIGHFEPFRPRFADTLWVELAEILGEFAVEARAVAAK
jgi:predicted alpha/beta hydrolase